jgi:hypothetical protein
MIQQTFAQQVTAIVQQDSNVIGLAIGGSWLSNELDEYSDLDLVLVTKEKIAGNKTAMLGYAGRFGKLLTAFTGEHVGEPRLLICLYDEPLLHVDIKFLTLPEFSSRVETPVIVWDTNDQLQTALRNSTAVFPYPDYQWIEDRFWIWVHYTAVKIGRGEYFEALDFLGFLRMVVLGPLLHIKNGNLPRGVRKAETQLSAEDLARLQSTVAVHGRSAILAALDNAVELYRQLRNTLFTSGVLLHAPTEARVMAYLQEIKQKAS